MHVGRPQRPRVKTLLNIGIKYFDFAASSHVLGAVGSTWAIVVYTCTCVVRENKNDVKNETLLTCLKGLKQYCTVLQQEYFPVIESITVPVMFNTKQNV